MTTLDEIQAEQERERRARLAPRQNAISDEGHAALEALANARERRAIRPRETMLRPMPRTVLVGEPGYDAYRRDVDRWHMERSNALLARINISFPGGIDPELLARRQRNAEMYGTTALSTDLSEAERNAGIVSRSPILGSHFANETNAQLSRDDIRPLSFWQIVGDMFRFGNVSGDFSQAGIQRQFGGENRTRDNIQRHIARGVYQTEMAALAEQENVESALDSEGSNLEGAPLARRLGNFVYRNSRMADDHGPLTREQQWELNAYRHDEMMGLIARADMSDNFGGWFLENIVPTAQGLAEIPAGAIRGGGVAWERAVRNWEMGGGGTPADAIERTWAVLSVAPDIAVSGAAGAALGPIAFTYQQEAGQAYLEYSMYADENGEFMDRRIAGAFARDVGIINSAFEVANFAGIARALGVTKLGGYLASSGVRSAFRRYSINEGLRRMTTGIAATALAEGGTEALQETTVIALGEWARLADSGALDDLTPGELAGRLWDAVQANTGRIWEAGVAGAVIGGGIGTVVAPITIGSLIEDARVGEYQQAIWQSIETQSENSKLRERSPGVYQRLISKLVQGTPLEQISINVEDFIGAFNQDVELARAAARELVGVGTETFDAAQQSGGEIFIPASTMSAQIAGTAQYEHIAKHSKLGAEIPSMAEVMARLELGVDVKAAIDAGMQFQEEFKTLDEAKANLRQQIIDHLRASESYGDEKFEEALAQIYADGVFAIAKAAGMDPTQLPPIPTIIGPFGARKLTQEEIDEGGFATMPIDVSNIAAGARGRTAFERTVEGFVKAAKVIFTEDRNESTAPHEIFGHYFLEIMRFVAAQPSATPVLKQDWQAILDHLGMTDERWAEAVKLSPKEAAKVLEPAHEKFARTVEVYFLEGRAPSLSLKRVMRMFKVWMVRAFRATKRMNKNGEIIDPLYQRLLDDRIRPVLDRMFATGEAIAEYAELIGSDAILTRQEWGGVGNKFADAAYERYKTRIVEARRSAEEAVDAAAIALVVKENMRERRRAEARAKRTVAAEMEQDPVWIAHDVISGRIELPNAPGIRLNSALVFEEYGKDAYDNMPNGAFDVDVEGLVTMAMEARGVKEPLRLNKRVQQLGIFDPSGQIEALQGNKKGLRKAEQGITVSAAINTLWDEGWFGERNTTESHFQRRDSGIPVMTRGGEQVSITPNPTNSTLMRMTVPPAWDRENKWKYDTLRYIVDANGNLYVAPSEVLHDDMVRALTEKGLNFDGYVFGAMSNDQYDKGYIRREGDQLVKAPTISETYLQPAVPSTVAFAEKLKNTKVVAADGRPLRVFTGTSKDVNFKKFRAARNGIWFDKRASQASQYAIENDSQGHAFDHVTGTMVRTNTASRVIPVYLNIENPMIHNHTDNPLPERVWGAQNYKRAQAEYFDELKAQGYDGVFIYDNAIVAFSDDQIIPAIGSNIVSPHIAQGETSDRQTDPDADPANDSGGGGRARETSKGSNRRQDRGAIWNYARASGSGNRGFRVLEDLGVQAIANITRDGQPNFVELDTLDPATVEKFRSLMQASKDASRFGAAVTVYSAAEYATMRLFLSEDGKTGGAIKSDGDMVSGFSSNRQGAAIMNLRLSLGGIKTDAFDTVLPDLYAQSGFRVVSRTPFNDEFAPEGWDYDTFAKYNGGRPDIVFMVYDPENAVDYEPGQGKIFPDYDSAAAAQAAAVADLQGVPRGTTQSKGEESYDQTIEEVAVALELTDAELEASGLSLMDETGAWSVPNVGQLKDVIAWIEERRLATGIPRIDIETEEGRDLVARMLAAEAMMHIKGTGDALEWYDTTIAKTIATMGLQFPELETDIFARNAFLMAMAISSQNLDPVANLRFAIKQYAVFRDTGSFPVAGTGTKSPSMAGNFQRANIFLEVLGREDLLTFLRTEFTVKELARVGIDIADESMDTVVLGSAIFGPKIGFGFYSNLDGNFEPVTMDMWFMRTIGRLTGLLTQRDPEKLAKQYQRMRAALTERGKATAGFYASQFDRDLVNRAKTSDDALIDLARIVSRMHERDYLKSRKAYDAKTRKKTELVLAAQRILVSLDKPKDQPASGGERTLLRDIVNRLVSLVEREYGTRIPPAAIQALIWYPEQELYKALGVKLRVTSMDYAIAAKQILIEGGISEQAIDQATGDAVKAAGSITKRSGSVRPGDGQKNPGRDQTNGSGFERTLSEEARAALLLKAQAVSLRKQQSFEETYDQTVEEFKARSQDMTDRIVGDVALSQDETFAIYSGLLADHNEKMIRAMRLSLAVEPTPVGQRQDLTTEAMVDATGSYTALMDVFSKMVSRYGQDAVSGLGVPISFEMRDSVVTTESLNSMVRERQREISMLRRALKGRQPNNFDMTPEQLERVIAEINDEIAIASAEIERRIKTRPPSAFQPTEGMRRLAAATDEEVLDWFHNSGEVRVTYQRDSRDPVYYFKLDPEQKTFPAHLTFDINSEGEVTCTTHYRGRFNNRDWQGRKKKPTPAQRRASMAFFARMALLARAYIILNKPPVIKFTGGSASHEKLYLSMMSLMDFSGYTARREREITGYFFTGPAAANGNGRSTVSDSLNFVLLRPDIALKETPRDIPPTAVSETGYFARNNITNRRAGQLIWFAEETTDVKNPTGAEPTRDPAASRFLSGGGAGNVRTVPLGIGSDDAITPASLAAKQRALRTLDEAEGWFYQNKEEAPAEGEFLDALRDDISGVSPRYRAQDIDAAFDWDEAQKVREFFARRGVDINAKPKELRAQIELIAEQLDSRGIDADTMAQALNAHLGYRAFNTGGEMVDAVVALPKRSDYIKQRVEEIVRGELGDPMDDMPSAAKLSMHNISEEERLLMELQATQDAAGSGAGRAINHTAKDYALRRIERMRVRELQNPDWILKTERRWAKAAVEAARKGDMAAANKAKFNQLVNFHLYKAARAVQTEMERTQLYFKKIQKLSSRTRITPDYYEQIEALLDQYEVRNISTKEVQRRIGLAEWIKEMEDKGLGHMVQIDPAVIARSGKTPFQQLTIEEARALRDAIKNLDHLGSLKDRLLAAADQRSFENVLSTLIGAMEQTGPVDPKLTRNYSESDVQKFQGKLRRWNAALTRMEFLFRYIDGKHNGPVWNALFLPFTKAADKKSAYQHRVAMQLSNLWDQYSESERASMFKTRVSVPELLVDSDVTGENDVFTRMQLIAIAMNVGNEGNVRALVDGFGWFRAPEGLDTDYVTARQKIIAVLDKHLNERDWRFVQETWNIIGQFRDEAFDLHQRLTGLRPEAVEASPVASKHGTFAGGYYPLKFDPLRDAVTERREAKENTPVNNWGVSSLAPMTKKGHLIDRKGSGGRPVRLDFAVATEHIENVIHDISYREALIDANRIVSDSRFRAAFIRTVGKEQYAQLHPWLHSIAVEYRDPTSDIGKLLQKMRGNMQIVTMGVKIATATQQLAGLLQAVPMLGSVEMAGGVVRMLNNPFQLREKSEYIMSKSEFMRTRVRTYNRDVREFLRRVEDDTLYHKTQRNAFALVGAMDWAVSSVVWITAYEKARAGNVDGIDGGVEEDAVRFADSMVRQTQSAGLNQDLPLVMRNTELEKMVTAFYSYFSVLYNWTAYDQVLGVRKGRVPPYIAAGNFFLIYILAPLITEWLAGRWDKEGEDDEERMQRMLRVIARMPFSSVPVLRDVVNTYGSFYDYSLTPFESGLQSAIDTVEDVASGDILTNESAQKNAAFAVGFVFGLPTSQMYITADYIRDYAEGEEQGLDLTEALLRDTR